MSHHPFIHYVSRKRRKPQPTLMLYQAREYPIDYRDARDAFEVEFLTTALVLHSGNVASTARAIGMARRNLQLKINRYEIDITTIRAGVEISDMRLR